MIKEFIRTRSVNFDTLEPNSHWKKIYIILSIAELAFKSLDSPLLSHLSFSRARIYREDDDFDQVHAPHCWEYQLCWQ